MGLGTLKSSDKAQDRLMNMFKGDMDAGSRLDQHGPNRKMSQSELSSVGSDSPGNSGNDERGSLIGDRGRTLQRTRTLGRNSSSGKGSRIGGKKDADAAGDYPTARVPLLNHLNL